MSPITVVLRRNGIPESAHTVHAVLCSTATEETSAFGDVSRSAFWRSSMKPFQALPLVEHGALRRLGLGEEALALACASHHGTTAHVRIVGSMLDALELDQEALMCGPHRPVDEAAARGLDEAGRLPERIHNNCSGKHAAMLALARARGWPLEGYARYEHPVQRCVRGELARWLGPDPEGLSWGVDGCGVPTPALPLVEMARAYARLAASREPGPRFVVSAMTGNPTLISGATALSANLMQATGGRVLAKEGAEGVFCLACAADGWGAAFKVVDGATRAVGPAVMHALGGLSLLRREEVETLSDFAGPVLLNTRAEQVGVLAVWEDDA